jgi:ATP-dependent Clp protease adaptor protein ClpS
MANSEDPDVGVVTREKTKQKLQKPRMFKVLMHNDDYTSREFVVEVLMTIFHRDEVEATRIMLHVHNNGVGIAGVYTREIAETKIATVHQLAKKYDFPLMLTMEPED